MDGNCVLGPQITDIFSGPSLCLPFASARHVCLSSLFCNTGAERSGESEVLYATHLTTHVVFLSHNSPNAVGKPTSWDRGRYTHTMMLAFLLGSPLNHPYRAYGGVRCAGLCNHHDCRSDLSIDFVSQFLILFAWWLLQAYFPHSSALSSLDVVQQRGFYSSYLCALPAVLPHRYFLAAEA